MDILNLFGPKGIEKARKMIPIRGFIYVMQISSLDRWTNLIYLNNFCPSII